MRDLHSRLALLQLLLLLLQLLLLLLLQLLLSLRQQLQEQLQLQDLRAQDLRGAQVMVTCASSRHNLHEVHDTKLAARTQLPPLLVLQIPDQLCLAHVVAQRSARA